MLLDQDQYNFNMSMDKIYSYFKLHPYLFVYNHILDLSNDLYIMKHIDFITAFSIMTQKYMDFYLPIGVE